MASLIPVATGSADSSLPSLWTLSRFAEETCALDPKMVDRYLVVWRVQTSWGRLVGYETSVYICPPAATFTETIETECIVGSEDQEELGEPCYIGYVTVNSVEMATSNLDTGNASTTTQTAQHSPPLFPPTDLVCKYSTLQKCLVLSQLQGTIKSARKKHNPVTPKSTGHASALTGACISPAEFDTITVGRPKNCSSDQISELRFNGCAVSLRVRFHVDGIISRDIALLRHPVGEEHLLPVRGSELICAHAFPPWDMRKPLREFKTTVAINPQKVEELRRFWISNAPPDSATRAARAIEQALLCILLSAHEGPKPFNEQLKSQSNRFCLIIAVAVLILFIVVITLALALL